MPPHHDQLPERLRRRVAEDVRRISETRVTLRAHFEQLQFLFGNFRIQDVDRLRIVVKRRRPEYYQSSSKYASYRECEQENSVQNHSYVFPIILDLEKMDNKYQITNRNILK